MTVEVPIQSGAEKVLWVIVKRIVQRRSVRIQLADENNVPIGTVPLNALN
jgi:hypothetical protein